MSVYILGCPDQKSHIRKLNAVWNYSAILFHSMHISLWPSGLSGSCWSWWRAHFSLCITKSDPQAEISKCTIRNCYFMLLSRTSELFTAPCRPVVVLLLGFPVTFHPSLVCYIEEWYQSWTAESTGRCGGECLVLGSPIPHFSCREKTFLHALPKGRTGYLMNGQIFGLRHPTFW